MFALNLLSYVAAGLGGVLLVASLALETWLFVPSAASAVVCAVLFMSGSKIIELLTQIRDRLPSPAVSNPSLVNAIPDADDDAAPARTLAELEADIARRRAHYEGLVKA